MNDNIKVYEPNSRNKSFFSIIKDMFLDLFSSKGLAYRLFVRDKKAEYRQSILGILWAFFTPLATTVTWIFLSSSGVVKLQNTDVPYPVFVFLGTMLWSVFVESLTMPLIQTQNAKDILVKVNFPKESILLSGVYKLLFNTVIKIALIIMVLLFYRVKVDLSGILLFPFILLLMLLFGYGIGLMITPVGMLYTDVGKAIPIIVSFAMYLSPVVYKGGGTGRMAQIIELNPLTPLINSSRNLLTGGNCDNPLYLLIIVGASLLLFFLGWLFYRIAIPIIVERM